MPLGYNNCSSGGDSGDLGMFGAYNQSNQDPESKRSDSPRDRSRDNKLSSNRRVVGDSESPKYNLRNKRSKSSENFKTYNLRDRNLLQKPPSKNLEPSHEEKPEVTLSKLKKVIAKLIVDVCTQEKYLKEDGSFKVDLNYANYLRTLHII